MKRIYLPQRKGGRTLLLLLLWRREYSRQRKGDAIPEEGGVFHITRGKTNYTKSEKRDEKYFFPY